VTYELWYTLSYIYPRDEPAPERCDPEIIRCGSGFRIAVNIIFQIRIEIRHIIKRRVVRLYYTFVYSRISIIPL
jgi:hypothetical protein